MSPARPLECPACGHERIARRPQRLHTGSGKLRLHPTEWMCQLCSYIWSNPRAPAELPAWEME